MVKCVVKQAAVRTAAQYLNLTIAAVQMARKTGLPSNPMLDHGGGTDDC